MSAVTEPGVYGMPPDVYHGDPVPTGSLSVSGARLLLPPSCPALYHWYRHNPRPPRADFDFGHVAHKLVLGAGEAFTVIDADSWRTKAAQTERDEARAAGLAPILVEDFERAEAMAAAIRAHPVAGPLFSNGKPEQALFWRDEETGVWRRALLDWLPNKVDGRHIVIPDYKTARSAAPEKISRALDGYGYAMQADQYLEAVRALGIDDDPTFVLVVQEKTEPYLISVVEPDPLALRIGNHRNRQALGIYAECAANDHWPDYTDGRIQQVSMPSWAEYRFLEETEEEVVI